MDRIDMPQINYDRYNGKKYRYFYGTGLFINQHFMNGVSDKGLFKELVMSHNNDVSVLMGAYL